MNMLKVTNLKVNDDFSPLGTDDAFPEFSWEVQGERQRQYRITVSENADFSHPVWDSGSVLSDESLHIEYAGEKLKSCTEYFWKVEVNEKAVACSTFETAFFNPEKEFCARWIGQPFGFVGCADDIRLDVQVVKAVKKARFYVAMLGTGKVYFNGVLLDDCYFDGGITVYSKTIGYRTYRLDPKIGNNALCMRVGYGFYGAKKVYGLLRIEYEDGEVLEMPTMSGRIWNVKKDVVTRNGVYDGETCDARLKDDWLARDYEVVFDQWCASFSVDAPQGRFRAIAIPPMRIVKRFSAQKVTKGECAYYVDAGENVCGFLSLKIKGERGASVTVEHAERLNEDGSLDNVNYRSAENKDVYILAGDGEERFQPEFTYHGFRFARISVTGRAEIADVSVCVLRSDLTCVSDFSCSNETLNRLHKIAVRTEGNNLNGVFTDCPQRDERFGWLNDLTSRWYQSVNNFALERFLPNFTDMTSDAQSEGGIIPDTVPYAVGCEIGDPVSAYTLGGLLAYEYYGDKKNIARNFNRFAKWIDYLKGQADANGGIIRYGYYGDWCPAAIYANGTKSRLVSESFMSSIYFLWYLKQMRLFASLIGRKEDEKKYAEYYSEYRARFDEEYYDRKRNVYGNGSQTELAVAVTVFDEDEQCAYWAKIAAEDVIARGYHTTCGNQGYRHLIYNLAKYGYGETVVKLLVNREYPGWGYMLENGATTVWERWENVLGDDMHSFDHPMFSAYDGFFINYLAGIRTDLCENCFKKIVIKPCFAESVDFCKAKLVTLRGEIAVDWKRENGVIFLTVEVPSGSDLKVIAAGAEIVCGDAKCLNEICVEGGCRSFAIVGARSEK